MIKPTDTRYNFLSLGAGVQSSTMALMAARGEIHPMPDAAIFADTQAEPQGVYDWLEWLEGNLCFPLHVVTRGSLTDRVTKKADNGNLRNMLPVFIKSAGGVAEGKLMRTCTMDYKIVPLMKKEKELAGVKRGSKDLVATSWIGISTDEVVRMKPSREKWVQHRWPLIEAGMSRHDCLLWMNRNGYPKPPRSACSYCPFHSNQEWRRLRDEEPEAFAEAVRVERELQALHRDNADLPGAIRGTPYMHRSLKPLTEVDFSTDVDRGQLELWGNECEGMCGL